MNTKQDNSEPLPVSDCSALELHAGMKFMCVKGGGPNRLRAGKVWELWRSDYDGHVHFSCTHKDGKSTMILNGFAVAARELAAGRIAHMPNAAGAGAPAK